MSDAELGCGRRLPTPVGRYRRKFLAPRPQVPQRRPGFPNDDWSSTGAPSTGANRSTLAMWGEFVGVEGGATVFRRSSLSFAYRRAPHRLLLGLQISERVTRKWARWRMVGLSTAGRGGDIDSGCTPSRRLGTYLLRAGVGCGGRTTSLIGRDYPGGDSTFPPGSVGFHPPGYLSCFFPHPPFSILPPL